MDCSLPAIDGISALDTQWACRMDDQKANARAKSDMCNAGYQPATKSLCLERMSVGKEVT